MTLQLQDALVLVKEYARIMARKNKRVSYDDLVGWGNLAYVEAEAVHHPAPDRFIWWYMFNMGHQKWHPVDPTSLKAFFQVVPDAEADLDRIRALRDVEALFNFIMDAQDQEVIHLVVIEGLTISAAARRLGRCRAWVRKSYKNTLKALNWRLTWTSTSKEA